MSDKTRQINKKSTQSLTFRALLCISFYAFRFSVPISNYKLNTRRVNLP